MLRADQKGVNPGVFCSAAISITRLFCCVLVFLVVAIVGCESRDVSSGDTGLDVAVTTDAGPDVVGTHDLPGDTSAPHDSAADAATMDSQVLDVGAADMNLSFPAVLEGVWLIGWSGGMNHFSWVRFAKMAAPTMTKTDVWILDGKDISTNLPLWDCNGKASYWMGAAADTIYLDFPSASCLPGGDLTEGYAFSDFNPSGAGAPQDAILSATVTEQATLQEFSGYKYPDTWCDATMTSCKAPW